MSPAFGQDWEKGILAEDAGWERSYYAGKITTGSSELSTEPSVTSGYFTSV